ncbi:ATP-binding protein [bacterium]|nr:ATP-binding protein [bacterium]
MTEEDLTDMIEDNQVPFRGQVFTQSDGLSSIECPIGFQPTATIDHNGTIWFASGKGLNSIAPERLKPNEVEPMIVFDNILYTDRSGQIQDLQQTDQKSPYQLPPDHSNLTIHFTSPSFASPEKIEFEIILKAPKQNIIKRQTSREIHFHRLEPGDYQLSIRPRNSDGFWAKDPGQVYFTVSPFYWQTLGFQASAGATAILLTGTLGFLLSRRQMSREVKFVKSERRLKNLLEETQRSALIGGWEYDTETKQLYWTQEAFSIHETQSEFELDLDRFYQFYRSNDQIELRAAIGDAQRTGQDFDLEVQTHAHGIWLRVTGKAVDSPSRKIYGCFQNIQHQKDREQFERNQEIQARQSQKLEAIGTLAGGIAHDFNNILTGIRGYTDLLAIDLDGDSKSREHVRELQDAATRATDLVKQILTYSRPGSEKLIPLNLIKVSRHALKLLRASIPSSVEIKTTLPSEIPLIAGSDSQIHQLLVNLFTNAAQSIGDLGTISCTLYSEFISQPETHSLGDLAQGTYAIFEIRDTGKGIETESIDRIFDPFFTTKQNAGGTGLGLSVVLGIVKSHQGAIRLRSDQSRGTTFHVYLPCIDHQTEVPLERPSLPKAGKGQHIMLIDDDKDVIDVTSKMIKRLGYSTECYLSSTTAVDAFHKATESYALVITDFTMPIMRGDVVVERIREIDSITPIILVSGNLEGKIPDNLDPSGRLHWLQKPFEYKELARVITKAIELGSNKSN